MGTHELEQAQSGGLIDKYFFLDILKIMGLIWMLLYLPISYFGYIEKGANLFSPSMIFIGIMNILAIYELFEVISK